MPLNPPDNQYNRHNLLYTRTLAPVLVRLAEIPKSVLTRVAPSTFDVGFTVTPTRLQPVDQIRFGVAYPVVQRTAGIAIARYNYRTHKKQYKSIG